MIQIISGGIFSFILCFLIMPFVIKIANEKKLYDLPDERKTHRQPIPSLGGIGIFVGLVLSLLLVNNFVETIPAFQYYLAAFFMLFIFGVLDDVFILSAGKKLCGQLIVTAILTFKGQLLITDLHGFLDINALNVFTSYGITFFTILLIINCFNLIDGVDGLAGSLGVVSCLVFGIFMMRSDDLPGALIAFCLAGSLLGFLVYNFHPAKIFMGDSGSMLIGLIMAILFIRFMENPAFAVKGAPSLLPLGLGILLLPIMDVLRVFCIRLSKGQSPFAPDRNHLHHLLLNKGFNHRQVTFILAGTSIIFAALAVAFKTVNINITVFAFAGIFFLSVLILKHTPSKYRWLHVVTDNDVLETNKNVKIVSIFPAETAAALEDD
jgi:UDP-GlcNAc:undecaprenyl-phosphate GlcNAc-1-phosphate transferase